MCYMFYFFPSIRLVVVMIKGWYGKAMDADKHLERRLLAARSYVHLGAGRANGMAQ